MNKIQVFEYQSLPLGSGGFKESHFDRLVQYNEIHGCKFFDVGHKKIRFKNYVGVIQVGSLVIEILPKADKSSSPDKEKWQLALIQMLRRSGVLKLESLTRATLQLRSASLLDLYIESFLFEVRRLTHEGLIRLYRRRQGNLSCLKGKLLFSKHISQNYVHRERFYVDHTVFDTNNLFNGIIRAALSNVAIFSPNTHLSAESKLLLFDFEDVQNVRVSENTFRRIRYNRNTERYRYAIQLAKLILLEYLPDIKGGREHVLAILFDMNTLFEKFIFAELKRAESQFQKLGLSVSAQLSRPFWGTKKLRPDILIELKSVDKNLKLILDTKWKVLTKPIPLDDDLRQMFAYNLYFGSNEAVLVYPKVEFSSYTRNYFKSFVIPLPFVHGCGLCFAELFDEDEQLRRNIGVTIINSLLREVACH